MAKRRPRDIGTAAETAVVRWLQDNGWPTARRQPLYGSRDQGDIIACESPKVLIECKGGAQAEAASHTLIAEWLHETETEAVHGGADLAVLIVRRRGRPPQLWDAYMPSSDWITVLTGDSVLPTDAPWPLRASLADWSAMVKGWADS